MCCAIVAMLLVLFPAWTGGREAVLRWMARARWVAVAAIAGATLAAGTAFAAAHAAGAETPAWAAHICSVFTN